MSPSAAPETMHSVPSAVVPVRSVPKEADSPSDGVAFHAPSTSAANPESDPAPPPVTAACLACRAKHLKCDGQTPCSRCVAFSCKCSYVASRRGYKGPRRDKIAKRNPIKLHPLKPARPPPPPTANQLALVNAATAGTQSHTSTFNPEIFLSNQVPFPAYPQATGPNFYTNFAFYNCDNSLKYAFAHHDSQMVVLKERYINAFYHHFYAAHPFVLPKEFLLPLAHDGTIEPLLAAIRWIGSLYIDGGSSSTMFLNQAFRLVYHPETPKDGFLIQAMLLLILGLDGNRERDKVLSLLTDIEQLSVRIGLNTRHFACINGQGIEVLEESWRRTWWDLYIIDAMIAGVHRTTGFLLFDVPTDVALPCEEAQYQSGLIPTPLHLEDMDRHLLDGTREFSSFAYRVQCALNLGRFMRVPPQSLGPKAIAKIDNLLLNWQQKLPPSKRDALDQFGQPDEMMFQAFMMVHAISILLHQPFSQLDPSPTWYINACAPNTPALSGDDFNDDTRRTIKAANEISKLITYPVPLLSHTHFFAYMVTLSSTVHLSQWALTFVSHDDDNLRQQIRLNLGALKAYAEVWPAADHLRLQVKGITQEVYRMKKQQLPEVVTLSLAEWP